MTASPLSVSAASPPLRLLEDELDALAAGITEQHRRVVLASGRAEAANREAVEAAVRAGGLLAVAKERIPHGAWLPWLAEHFPGSVRTAQLYMRLDRHGEDAQRLAHLGVAGVDRALGRPDAKRPVPRPRAERRAEALAKIVWTIARDAERGEGRVTEMIDAYPWTARLDRTVAPVEDVRLAQRVLHQIAAGLAAREDPRPPLLCPTCGRLHE